MEIEGEGEPYLNLGVLVVVMHVAFMVVCGVSEMGSRIIREIREPGRPISGHFGGFGLGLCRYSAHRAMCITRPWGMRISAKTTTTTALVTCCLVCLSSRLDSFSCFPAMAMAMAMCAGLCLCAVRAHKT